MELEGPKKNGLRTGLRCRAMEGRQHEYEWEVLSRSGEGLEWDGRKWKNEIDRVVKGAGLCKWKNGMEQKRTVEWFREKERPMYERWHDSR